MVLWEDPNIIIIIIQETVWKQDCKALDRKVSYVAKLCMYWYIGCGESNKSQSWGGWDRIHSLLPTPRGTTTWDTHIRWLVEIMFLYFIVCFSIISLLPYCPYRVHPNFLFILRYISLPSFGESRYTDNIIPFQESLLHLFNIFYVVKSKSDGINTIVSFGRWDSTCTTWFLLTYLSIKN